MRRDPANIHGMCEDYRAAASIDLEHDKADLDKKIACPVLALWGAKAPMGRLYDVLSIWRSVPSRQRAIASRRSQPAGGRARSRAAELRAFLDGKASPHARVRRGRFSRR